MDRRGIEASRDLQLNAEEARALFPFREYTQWNLTVTHKTRLHLNALLNERWKTGDAVWIEVGDVTMGLNASGQQTIVRPGTSLRQMLTVKNRNGAAVLMEAVQVRRVDRRHLSHRYH